MLRIDKNLNVIVVELVGEANEMGYTQGKRLKNSSFIEKLEPLQRFVNPEDAANKLEEISPTFLQELTGLAEGAKINKETAIQLFSGYNVVMPPMGCSTYANETFYVRNYDFSDQLYDARLVFQKPETGYASVGFSQQILGRLDGMNEKGLVIGLHFVNEQFKGEGFLATTICRLVLDQCTATDEAIRLIKEIPQRYCYNYSILDSNGNAAIVEATPDKLISHHSVPLTCTNHFQSQQDKNKQTMMLTGSKKRKEVIDNLKVRSSSPLNYYEKFNNKNSPLFFKYYEQFFGTLHTVVYHPKDLSIIVGVGGDCEPYHFSLKKWLKGEELLPQSISGKIEVLV
ncbi:C45 family autoproteolytic acyltransferase/hydolase [Oceanobacillus sp. CAU 1775]